MVDATFLRKFSAVSVATVLVALRAVSASAQETGRVNQDELASFYGRMNVVVGSGARAFGMGGAFLARADDATAASWNPAGLSYLRRTEFSLVGVHNDFLQKVPREVVDSTGRASLQLSRDQLRGSVADFAGFAYPLRFRGRTGAVQLSYQRSFSFSGKRNSEGLGADFQVDGSGGFDSLSLSSGFEINPRLRMGVSVNRWIDGFSQTVSRQVQNDKFSGGSTTVDPFTRISRRIDSSWEITGTNFNLGALFTPTPKLNLGAVFKTAFSADIRLYKKRTDGVIPAPLATAAQAGFPPEGGVDTTTVNRAAQDVTIRFPRVFGVGGSYRATNTVTLSADFTRTQWSKASITNFFSLPAEKGIDLYSELPFPAVEESANGQIDTNQIRLGGEWVLRLGPSGDVLLPLRAGFFRDAQPFVAQVDSQTVKPTFTGLTAGIGVNVGGMLLDIAYSRETGKVPLSGRADLRPREIKYNRLFASVIFRVGPRR